MAQVLRLYIQMFLSYRLYVCIILETAYHRTTIGIFCNITQNTTPEENSHRVPRISSPIVFFSYGKVKDIFCNKEQILIWKKEGVKGGHAKIRWVFCKIPFIK